jgi:hypothetical protein
MSASEIRIRTFVDARVTVENHPLQNRECG